MIVFHLALSQLVLCAFVHHASSQTGPNYCTYASGVYTCDYSSMPTGDRPIDYTQFSVQPQQLVVTVNGFMPYSADTRTFSETFSNMDTSLFDSNCAASLSLDCGRAGQLYFGDGALYNMSYVQSLKIKNCDTYFIPANTFADIANLDYFGFEGGLIDDVDPNGMAGLNVEKLTSDAHQIPRNIGHFEILYSKFVSGSIQPGLLFSWKNLTSATLRGASLISLSADVFKFNLQLRYIDLSDNTFTSLPSGLLSGLESLSDLQLYNIDWQCTCDNLWFIGYARDNNITLFGDLMCSNQQGTTCMKYYYDNCDVTDVCDGMAGFASGDKCQTTLGVCMLIMSLLALVACLTALAVAIINMRNIPGQENLIVDRSLEIRNMWKKAVKLIVDELRLRKEMNSPEDDVDHGNGHIGTISSSYVGNGEEIVNTTMAPPSTELRSVSFHRHEQQLRRTSVARSPSIVDITDTADMPEPAVD